jgi:hypothetical protein
MTKPNIRVLFIVLTSAGVGPCLHGQAAQPAGAPSSALEAIKDEFSYTSTIPASLAKPTDQNGTDDTVKMKPFHVYAPQIPTSSEVDRNGGMRGFDLGAERKIWSASLGRLHAEIGVLKYKDLLPFGAPIPRWTIFRFKW